jgi:hypothetical protein
MIPEMLSDLLPLYPPGPAIGRGSVLQIFDEE